MPVAGGRTLVPPRGGRPLLSDFGPMPTSLSAPLAFDLKSTAWTLTALRLHTADSQALAQSLAARFGDTPGLFDDDPVVLDLSALADADAVIDFQALQRALRQHRLLPIAVQSGSQAQTEAARAAGLADALDAAPAVPATQLLAHAVPEVISVSNEALSDATAPAREAPAAEVSEAAVARELPGRAVPTLVVDKPLRSGQRVYARGADLVVLAVVSFGAEVIADGNIHVYAPLRGRAIAGARGNTEARIFCTCLEPQLVSIAGIYRTTETELPDNVLRKPAQVRLDGERLLIEPLTP